MTLNQRFLFPVVAIVALFFSLTLVSCESGEDSAFLNLSDTELADTRSSDQSDQEFRGHRPRPGHRPGCNSTGNRPPRGLGFLRGDCVEIQYPITILFPDGTSTDVNNDDELATALQDWRQNGNDSLGRPELQFPITVTANDSTVVLNSSDDFQILRELCRPTGGNSGGHRGPCFDINYPVDFLMPDGSTISVESRQDKRDQFRQFRQNNPDVEGRPELVFPIDVTLEDGTVVTINSKDELSALCN